MTHAYIMRGQNRLLLLQSNNALQSLIKNHDVMFCTPFLPICKINLLKKWVALAFKLFVFKKTHIWTPFNLLISLDDAFLFGNKENKIILDPAKKAHRYDCSRTWLHAHVFVYYTNSLWPGFLLGGYWVIGQWSAAL